MTTLPTLTADQQAAADQFAMFLFSQEKEFVISGGAGVGKTTLLKMLMQSDYLKRISQLMGKSLPDMEWRFTATTNKAAEVLRDMGFLDATTIHSLLGLKVSNNYDTGTSKIERTNKSPIISNSIIIIDECSMVDSLLRKLINEGTFNCKLVYVGDHCQMAPITETLSPVFGDNTPAVINEIVRSKNAPHVTALCQQLRETVETGIFRPLVEVPGWIDYLSPEDAQRELTNHFVVNPGSHNRVLYFRNEQVLAMNNWIRQSRGLPTEFHVGELLVSNGATVSQTTLDGKRYMLSVEQQIELTEVSPIMPMDLKVYGLDASMNFYTVTCKYGTYRVACDPGQLKVCLAYLSKKKSWHQFFQLKEAFADLRMREACTVYKAQGSTYHTVFIDLSDIARCHNPAQVARMLYVACSRPTHRICFIGRLPEKYGG